ncbi:MAG TPA: hypothetical protein VGV68_08710 [Terriglobia bacterium]|nr:hypothetical protein [Terriglobia bacterium]
MSMPTVKECNFLSREIKANRLYQDAEAHWRKGRLHAAFRLFLAAARAGSGPALETVANFYDLGVGVKADQKAALYWYRRAYRHGSNIAANNIGVIWRDKKKLSRALLWLRRAVVLGDGDANLQIAKIYLGNKPDPLKAIHYLERTCRAANATQGSKEEARELLKQARKRFHPG